METPEFRDRRAVEVAKRLSQGASVSDLAAEYQVNRITIWRWNSQGTKSLLPALDDRETWREELAATFAERIAVARENGDDRALVKLAEGLRKMLGLDHADAVNEAMVRIEAAKLDMLSEALIQAMFEVGVDDNTRIRIGHVLDQKLAALEAKR